MRHPTYGRRVILTTKFFVRALKPLVSALFLQLRLQLLLQSFDFVCYILSVTGGCRALPSLAVLPRDSTALFLLTLLARLIVDIRPT